MKEAKENWVGEQCSEIEENLRKNNSKRACQLVKDLTTVKQGKATTVQDRSGKCLTEEQQILNRGQNTALSCTTTRPMKIHQYGTVPRQTQRMTIPSFAEMWRLQYIYSVKVKTEGAEKKSEQLHILAGRIQLNCQKVKSSTSFIICISKVIFMA